MWSHPAGQHRFVAGKVVHADLIHDRPRDLGSGRQRRRAVHDQNGVGVRVRRRGLQAGDEALGARIADDVDRIGARPSARQCRIELCDGFRRELGEAAANPLNGIGRKHARAAVSAAALPFGVAVEIDGIFRVR